jgi:hypothetical protein
VKKPLSRILATLGAGGLLLCCTAPLLLTTGVLSGSTAALLGIFAEQWVLPAFLIPAAFLLAGLWRGSS